MKLAHVYDLLVSRGGGEKLLAEMVKLFPAPVYTLIHDPKKVQFEEIYTSFLQKFPFSKQLYRYYLPLYPLAVEQLDLRAYDLILSTSYAVAKGVLTRPDQLHLCYCLTPMRCAWELNHEYLGTLHGLPKIVARGALHYLRNWEMTSLPRVDRFAAISYHIARKIKKLYRREATVIYPGIDTEKIAFQEKKENFYLTISRLVYHKRIDLIIEAFSHLPHLSLVVIGDGPEMAKLRAKAGKNVELLGEQEEEIVQTYRAQAKGFIHAAEEDFGIAVVEAQAAGTGIIAFGKGGALETVVENQTGLFFKEQSVDSLIAALQAFEKKTFDPHAIRKHARRFHIERFKEEMRQFVEEAYESHHLSWR